MRILVTGASGTIGSAAARALLRRGHEVTGVVPAAGRPVPPGVTPLVIDLFRPAELVQTATVFDGVIHAASSNDERSAALDTGVIAALTAGLAGSGKPLVYTSGLWLHGNTGDQPATEDSPLDPPMVVAWRPAVEATVSEAASRGVRSVIIRPGLVYGNGAGFIPALLAPHEDGVVRHFGPGTNRWSLVHADDLGALYALAAESAPAGSVYLATRDESIPVRDVAAAMAARAGASVQAWDPDVAAQNWGVMVEAFMLDQQATSARAQRELGWKSELPSIIDELS